jgi:transposase
MKSMERCDIVKMDDIKEKLYIGLDIHEANLTGTAMRKDGTVEFHGSFPNTREATQCFLSGIPSPQVKIAIEACGLWRGVYMMLSDLGYHVVMANPLKTHQIVGAKKTDKVDSKALADLLRTGYLPQVYIPTEDVLLLRDAARHRRRLVSTRQRLQCMTKSYLLRDGIKFPDRWNKEAMEFYRNVGSHIAHFINIIETINSQIKDIEKEIRGIARNSHLAGILQTVPGIAEFSSLMILGEIGDVKRFPDPKNLVSYAGLCPGIYQSGTRSYPVENEACNKWLKWIMYESSGRAIRMDTKYKKHYWRVYKKKREQTARRSTTNHSRLRASRDVCLVNLRPCPILATEWRLKKMRCTM